MKAAASSLAALALVAAAALAAAGCSRAPSSGTSEAQASAAAGGASPAPVSVTLQTVAKQRVERTVDFVGTLYAYAEAEVAAEVDGRLTTLSADLGDQVAKGQVLATLEGSELEAKLREAEASLSKTENDQRRAQQLRDQKIMSIQEFDAITSAASVSRARRDVLAIQVENTRIRAPFDGRIAKRLVDVGNYVRTGTPVFVLVADNPLRLRGEVPERFASEIATGQEVRGFVEAYPDDAIDGRLTRISPAANPQSRALTVEALVPNGDGRLKTGFFCKAQILTRTDDEALVVPVESLVSFAGVTRVFVVDETGTAHAREIATGLHLGAAVEVTEGLLAGERVATSGLARLAEGTKVVVREPGGPPSARQPARRDASQAGVAAEDTDGAVRIDPEPQASQPRAGLGRAPLGRVGRGGRAGLPGEARS